MGEKEKVVTFLYYAILREWDVTISFKIEEEDEEEVKELIKSELEWLNLNLNPLEVWCWII